MLRGYLFISLAIAAALLAAGCGDDDSEDAPESPPETAEAVPELPGGWTVHRNQNAGVAVGVPPAWSAENDGNDILIRSPERLVAATILADRSDEALETPLDQLAETTITGITGIRDLEPGETVEYKHRYDAVEIDAVGVAGKQDVKQDFQLVLLRRDDLATFTVLVARNAEENTNAYDDEIKRMIASIRTRPPG